MTVPAAAAFPSAARRPAARPQRHRAAAVLLAAVLALGASHCGTSPSGNPFGHCPAGTHRIRDVTRPPGQQWVCVFAPAARSQGHRAAPGRTA